jgi:DNA-directed RNA polymerase subunit L
MMASRFFANLQTARDAPEAAAGAADRCPSSLSFETRGIPLHIVNAVRRAVMSEIPTPALNFDLADDESAGMTFVENTSAFHNEYLAHRLSMVPIHLDAAELQRFEPDRYRFVLKERNRSDAAPLDVTSAHIQVYDQMGAKYDDAARDRMFPPHPRTGRHVLIVRLQPSARGDTQGEAVHVEMGASVGLGRDHARFTNVSRCYFRPLMDRAAAEAAAPPAEASPEERAAYWANEAPVKFVVPGAHEVVVACETCLDPAYLVFRAFRVLEARVRAIDVSRAVAPLGPATGVYALTLRDEDHTLGALLQGGLYDALVTEAAAAGDRQPSLSYVGYHVPHPQERLVVIKFSPRDAGESGAAAVAPGLVSVADSLRSLNHEWVRAAGLAATCAPVRDWLDSERRGGWRFGRNASGARPARIVDADIQNDA